MLELRTEEETMNETLHWPVACATGHRNLDVDVWGWVEREIKRVGEMLRDVHGTTEAISGMALGADTTWFETTDALDGLNAHAYAPYPQQADRWLAPQRERWRRNIERAREAGRLTFVGDLSKLPPADRKNAGNRLLHARNDAMLFDSQVVVAVYDPRRNHNSGTHDAFLKATGKRGVGPFGRGPTIFLPVIHINPQVRETRLRVAHLPDPQRQAIRHALSALAAPVAA